MNAVIVPDRHSFGDFLRCRLVARHLHFTARGPQLEQRVTDIDSLSASRVRNREALAVRDDDRRHQALRTLRQRVEIEVQQRLAAANAGASRDQHLEAFAGECDRIDTDVQEDLRSIRRAQRDGMPRGRDGNHLAIARRVQHSFGRIDRDAVTEQPLCKDGVGCFVERRAPAAQRRNQRQIRHARSCQD